MSSGRSSIDGGHDPGHEQYDYEETRPGDDPEAYRTGGMAPPSMPPPQLPRPQGPPPQGRGRGGGRTRGPGPGRGRGPSPPGYGPPPMPYAAGGAPAPGDYAYASQNPHEPQYTPEQYAGQFVSEEYPSTQYQRSQYQRPQYQQQQTNPGQYQQSQYQQPQYQQQQTNPGGASYNKPPVMNPPMQSTPQWTTGLFDMGADPMNCVITFLLPCVTFGQIAEVVDQGTTSCMIGGLAYVLVMYLFGCPCFVSCLWRTKLRAKYNLPPGECGDDFLTHLFCEQCALCQEYRELKNRGLDPSLGWAYLRNQQAQGYQQQQPAMGIPMQTPMQR